MSYPFKAGPTQAADWTERDAQANDVLTSLEHARQFVTNH
jgi:hypothetical protein